MKSAQWNNFARYINGTFIKNQYWHSAKVEVDYRGYKIVFDNYTMYQTVSSTTITAIYTRVIAPIELKQEFYFKVYRKNVFSSIAKFLGMQDVETGHPEFDKDFIIKSNNGFKIKQLLNNQQIRHSIENIKNINISISKREGVWGSKLPDKQAELAFYSDEDITDFEKLKELYTLFTIVIDQIQNMAIIK